MVDIGSCVTNVAQKALTAVSGAIMQGSGADSLLAQMSAKKAALEGAIASVVNMAEALPNLITELGALALNATVGQIAALAKRWGLSVEEVMSLLGNICGAPNMEGTPNGDGTYSVKMKASLAATPGGERPAGAEPAGETSSAELPPLYETTRAVYNAYQISLNETLAPAIDTLVYEKREGEIELGLSALKFRAASVGMDYKEYVNRYSNDITSDEQTVLSRMDKIDEERAGVDKLHSELVLAAAGLEKKIANEPGRDVEEIRRTYDRTIEVMTPSSGSADFVGRAKIVGNKICENEKVIRDFFQFGTQSGSTSVTGFPASPGSRITSYGYEKRGQKYFDTNSGNGIGIKDLKLSVGDFALSPDLRSLFEANGITHTQYVMIKLSNGAVLQGRWRDVTAKIHPETGKAMKGRVDIYSPAGPPSYDGISVVGFGILPANDQNLIASVRP